MNPRYHSTGGVQLALAIYEKDFIAQNVAKLVL